MGGMIVDRIDADADGIVSVDELTKWIKFRKSRYVNDNVKRQWTSHKPDGKDTISWEEYRQAVEDAEEEERGYKQKEARDYRLMAEAQALTKWSMADLDRSGELDIQEFAAFLHPEHAQLEWIMEEFAMMDKYSNAIDTDGNGLMDLE